MKIGDKVRILGKSRHCSIYKCKYNIDDIDIINFIFDVGTISLKEHNYYSFLPQDLELVKKEKKEMKKYTLLKTFNAVDIKAAQPDTNCSEFKDEYIKFLERYGKYYIEEHNFSNFIKDATEKQIKFCTQHGFIKEIKEKKYKIETELTENEFRYLMSHLNMSDSGFKAVMEMGSNSYNYDYKNKSDKIQMDTFKKFKNIFINYLNM